MFRSDSVYFLGFRTVIPQHHYEIETRFELTSNNENFYKCDVVVEKQNNVFKVISVQNFQVKKQEKFIRHDLPWAPLPLNTQGQENVLNWILDNEAFIEVLKEEKWLFSITDFGTITNFQHIKREDKVFEIFNNNEFTLANGEMFSIKVELHECYGFNYIGSIYLYNDYSTSSNIRKRSFEDRKKAYLVQLLSDEVLKAINIKVRLFQVTSIQR